jgi:hypothetical protein
MNFKWAVTTICLLAALPAVAQSLYPKPTDFWMAPVTRPLKMYGPTAQDARWFIAQWSNPDPLPGFESISSTNGSQIYRSESRSASVTVFKGADNHYTLSQNGADLTCSATTTPEFDLFASVKPTSPPTQETTTLGQMHNFRLTTDLKIDRQWPAPGSQPCNHNAVNVLAAVVLRNTTTSPPQALYYQLSLYEYCAPGPKEDACNKSRDSRFFWWSGIVDKDALGRPIRERFGVRDTLTSYGAIRPSLGKRDLIQIDLKPRLEAILATGPNNIDRNPDHWFISGPYNGQSLFGRAGLESTWYGFDLAIDR